MENKLDLHKDLFGDDFSEDEETDDLGNEDFEVKDETTISRENTTNLFIDEVENLHEHASVFIIKIPNFLSIDPAPFDCETFDEYTHSSSGSLSAIGVENTIRWRINKQSSEFEHNSRIIQWSDGTLSLQVGEEFFEGTFSNQESFRYILARQKEGNVLQVCGKVKNGLLFRPSGTKSRTHIKLTASVLEKHQKILKTKQYQSNVNPELAKLEVAKLEQEKLKSKKKLENKRSSVGRNYYYDSEDEIDKVDSQKFENESSDDDSFESLSSDEVKKDKLVNAKSTNNTLKKRKILSDSEPESE
jgi:RNA polymerase-associated protein LEO1